jgi:hypothetical protein
MKRFITDEPEGMFEGCLNMAFSKNKEVYLRGIGEGGEDVSLVNYCKKECKERCDRDLDDVPVEVFAEYMDCECSIAILHSLAIGSAELRGRLKKYEDTGLELDRISRTLAAEERVKELEKHLRNLILDMGLWGKEEDGIPETMFDDWNNATKFMSIKE